MNFNSRFIESHVSQWSMNGAGQNEAQFAEAEGEETLIEWKLLNSMQSTLLCRI